MPKKTKAIKKTDLKAKKPWLKKKGLSIIDEPKIQASRTFLIVCEGQTEELYFKSFASNAITVKCLSLSCSDAQIVNCAIDLCSGENYDEVWVVFDLDYDGQKGSTQFAAYDNAIQKAAQHDIQVAYSNDCFELWFYLHYQFTDQQQLRYFYYKKLGEYWDINYEKEGKVRAFAATIRQRLANDERACSQKAIENAETLYEQCKDLPYHKQNPVTTVFQLFKALTTTSKN